jgi:type IV secretory pathway VirB4 component
MNVHRTALAAVAATALAAGLALPAFAQADSEVPQATQPAAPTEEELQSYAAAAQQIQQIVEEWQPQIANAATPEEANQLGQQAQVEMVMAVEAEGLSVDDYNRITQLAQADPDLQARIMSYMQQQ